MYTLNFETHPHLGVSLGLENMKTSVSILKKPEKCLVKVLIWRFQDFKSQSQSGTSDKRSHNLGIGLENVNPVSQITGFERPDNEIIFHMKG